MSGLHSTKRRLTQRQDSLSDQMETVIGLASRAGCYDAVDHLRRMFPACAACRDSGIQHYGDPDATRQNDPCPECDGGRRFGLWMLRDRDGKKLR